MNKQQHLVNDVIAGLTTSLAAMAMGAAFGVQSGRGAFAGMVASAIIPIITSIFGGTRIQASGPTAPMTAVSTVIITFAYIQFGTNSSISNQFITLVFLLHALFMVLAGVFRLGRFISLVPQLVILGFMNGIAVLIWNDQIQKIFGLGGKVALKGESWQNALLAFATFSLIIVFPLLLNKLKIPEKARPFLPGTLVVIVSLTLFFILTKLNLETVKLGSAVSTLGEFVSLPSKFLPTLNVLTFDYILKALPYATQLTMLAYLDSLLTSLVIDKVNKEETKKEKELMAQGLSNGLSAIFGGILGAQSTVASIILLKEGAKTRLAGVLIGVFTFIGVFAFQGVITLVASAIFAGVLLKAGFDVFDKDYFKHYFNKKWYTKKIYNWQLMLIIFTTIATVAIDLNVAVVSGTILFYLGKKYYGLVDVDESEVTNIQNEG